MSTDPATLAVLAAVTAAVRALPIPQAPDRLSDVDPSAPHYMTVVTSLPADVATSPAGPLPGLGPHLLVLIADTEALTEAATDTGTTPHEIALRWQAMVLQAARSAGPGVHAEAFAFGDWIAVRVLPRPALSTPRP